MKRLAMRRTPPRSRTSVTVNNQPRADSSHHQLPGARIGHPDQTVTDHDQALRIPGNRLWINHMFLHQHARAKCPRVIVRQYRYGGLNDDRTVIEFGGHQMNSRAVHLATRGNQP